MNLFTYILLVGTLVGILASLPKIGLRTIVFVFVAFVGAFLGLMLVFGDAPLFLRFPFLFNERVTPVVVSPLFVLITLFVEKTRLAKFRK